MCSTKQSIELADSGLLGAGIAVALAVPLVVIVTLAVVFNWGR
jgi:hypothetical protein